MSRDRGRVGTGERIEDRLRRATYRMRSPWVLLEALLVAAAIAYGALWLAIPDANGGERALSGLLALGGAAFFLWAQSHILLLARRRTAPVAAWPGALLLLGLAVVYWLVATFFDAGQIQDASRTLDWSPHLPGSGGANLRVLMGTQRLVWDTLRLAVFALLLPFAMEGAATGVRGQWSQRAASLLRKPMFWAAVFASAAVGTVVTEGLLRWRPQVPVVVEIVLAISKVLVIFAVDVGALCFAVSLTGTYLRDAERRDAERAKGEGREALPSSGRRRKPQTEPAK